MLLPSTAMILHCGNVLAGSDSCLHALGVLSFGSRTTPLSVHSHTAIIPQSSITRLALSWGTSKTSHMLCITNVLLQTQIFLLSSDILFLQSNFISGAPSPHTPIPEPLSGSTTEVHPSALLHSNQMTYANNFKVAPFILQSPLTSGQPSPPSKVWRPLGSCMLAKHKSLILTGLFLLAWTPLSQA